MDHGENVIAQYHARRKMMDRGFHPQSVLATVGQAFLPGNLVRMVTLHGMASSKTGVDTQGAHEIE